jgi:hypothetical protein
MAGCSPKGPSDCGETDLHGSRRGASIRLAKGIDCREGFESRPCALAEMPLAAVIHTEHVSQLSETISASVSVE